MGDTISYADFLRVEIHSGRILEAAPLEGVRKPSYRLRIDFGPLGIKKSSAQLTVAYTPESLVGRSIMAVTNFPPKQIGGFMSEVLVLGFPCEGGKVILAEPERDVPAGTRLL